MRPLLLDLNNFTAPNGLSHLQEARRKGRRSVPPNVQPHRGPNTNAVHDRVCHIPEIRTTIHTDINPKCRPCGRQDESLYFLLIVEGWRHTSEYLSTRHPQTHIQPGTAHVQCLVGLPPFLSLLSLAYRETHPPVCSHQNTAFPRNACTRCVSGFAIRT